VASKADDQHPYSQPIHLDHKAVAALDLFTVSVSYCFAVHIIFCPYYFQTQNIFEAEICIIIHNIIAKTACCSTNDEVSIMKIFDYAFAHILLLSLYARNSVTR